MCRYVYAIGSELLYNEVMHCLLYDKSFRVSLSMCANCLNISFSISSARIIFILFKSYVYLANHKCLSDWEPKNQLSVFDKWVAMVVGNLTLITSFETKFSCRCNDLFNFSIQ